MKAIDWSEKVDPNHINWTRAELVCQDIARGGCDLDLPRPEGYERTPSKDHLAPFRFISGYGAAPPWVVNPRTDRVIAYHGFDGTWVGWDRGGPVVKLDFKDIIKFLRGEV